MNKTLIFVMAVISFSILFGCGGTKRYRKYNKQDEFFLAYPSNPREETTNHFSDSNKIIYGELLVNNSSMPFKVVYSQRSIISMAYGEVF